MCLIFISVHHHPAYKLVVAANRDEFYARRTESAAWWKDNPDVVGGRDQEAMGTWMAMTKGGRIALVTNYRDPKNINPKAPSRGKLVSDYLIGSMPPFDYLKSIEAKGSEYNGFNLVVGGPDALYYYSNYGAPTSKIQNGFYGLSNHLLETPWPKVARGKQKLQQLLQAPKLEPDILLNAMYDDQVAPDDRLPDTGIGFEREKALSSMFIKTPNYGTRCSTVVLVDKKNNVTYSERVYDLVDFSYKTNTFRFGVSE